MLQQFTKRKRQRLFHEPLEGRQMMAGDVTVNVTGGNLFITGDALANQIAITAGAQTGQYVISGLAGSDGVVTTINGSSTAPFTAVGVRKNITISMGDGDDVVLLDNLSAPRDVLVNLGAGSDQVAISQIPPTDPAQLPKIDVRGDLVITGGAGDDTVTQADAQIRGHELINLGAGVDTVNMNGSVTPTTTTARGIRRNLDPTLGIAVGNLIINMGADNGSVSLSNIHAQGAVAVNQNSGTSTVTLNNIRAGLVVGVNTGGGDDTVSLTAIKAGAALINTGGGSDHVTIQDLHATALSVLLGSGDDDLTVGGSDAHIVAFFGADGTDTLNLLAGNRLGRRFHRGFETVNEPVTTGV